MRLDKHVTLGCCHASPCFLLKSEHNNQLIVFVSYVQINSHPLVVNEIAKAEGLSSLTYHLKIITSMMIYITEEKGLG